MAENTFFAEIHQELQAKTAPVGKWNIPLFYPGGSIAEHRHTRGGASIFDMSCSRIFQITGSDTAKKLDSYLSGKVAKMAVGCCMENILLHENGTFALLFTLCRMQENDFMLLTEVGSPDKEISYMLDIFSKLLEVRELTGAMAHLAVIGKKSEESLHTAGAENLPENGKWAMITVKDDEDDEYRAIAIRHDRFGEMGFELCCNAALALEFYGALYHVNGLSPAGWQAWESLRIESGTPGVPGELNEKVFPQECGFFPDMEQNLPESFTPRKLVVVDLERYPAQPGSTAIFPGNVSAVVTSSAFCPVAGCARAICLTEATGGWEKGDPVTLSVNGKEVRGIISGKIDS